MPTFYGEDIDIDVDDFLSACDSGEIKELIQALVDDGHISKSATQKHDNNMCAAEQIYEDKLNKLHGVWTRLSKEDEETIVKIADKF
jgi:hypothetical protein